MTTTRLPLLTDQLRQAIDGSGLTRYRIAKETGIHEAALSKFYHGQRGLSMTALNALGEFLGLRIVRAADGSAPVKARASAKAKKGK